MDAVLGAMLGVAATVIVARYYFFKTTNKQLDVYVALSYQVFAGIGSDVQSVLSFAYNDKPIEELQQIDLVVANVGNRACQDFIEPLTITIDHECNLLDCVVLHKSPSDLKVNLDISDQSTKKPSVTCDFPLLNANECFYIKLLIDKHIQTSDLKCHLVCKDLPRSFEVQRLPYGAMMSEGRKIEWNGLMFGFLMLAISASIFFVTWSFYESNPKILPYPWEDFKPSWRETPPFILAFFGGLLLGILGLFVGIGMAFEDFLSKRPSFILPKEFRSTYSAE